MTQLSLKDRTQLAEKIISLRYKIAEDVTEEFFRRHPDWMQKYGERGRARGIEDAIYHMNFLAAALQGGSLRSFEDYARWASGMLKARNIDPHFVVENFAR